MKRMLFPTLATLLTLTGCGKNDEQPPAPDAGEERIETIAQAKAVLARQFAGGVLVKTADPLTDKDPGGWRVEFTGGSPATIDLMNGSDAVNGLTPKLVVRHNADGSTTLWINEGDGLMETRTTLTDPFDSEITIAGTYTPPMMDVRRDASGILTVWYNPEYGYPDKGWKDTGVKLRAGSGTGSVEAQGPVRAIIDNEARGTVTVWLNDEEHTNYTFEKFSSAYRFNIMNDDIHVNEGGTTRILLIVSSSEAWIPTGAGEWIDRWELNDPQIPGETRAGYVQPCPNCTIERVLPSGLGQGEYIVTIRSQKANLNMIDQTDVHALVLNTNTDEDPKLVSSTRFNMNSNLPESANSIIMKPNSSFEIGMAQLIREHRAGFVSATRIQPGDDVEADWVWADKPGTMTPAGIVANLDVMTPANSGLDTRIRVTTGPTEGNVVVAARVDGAIVWSWHIWCTNYDPETQNKSFMSTGERRLGAPDAGRPHTFMDRNLGALSNVYVPGSEDYSAFGMLYQWGRKDPLVGHMNVKRDGESTGPPIIYTRQEQNGTPIPFLTTGVTAGIRYSIEHPEAFIYLPNSYTGQWSWNDLSSSSLAALWYDGTDVSYHVTKSVYDPCPAGWRLPSNGILEGFQPTDTPEMIATNKGHVDTPFGYIPYAGHVDYNGTVVRDLASFAFYTSQKDIPIWYSRWQYGERYVTSGGSQYARNGSNAYSVRCVKED